MYYILFLILSSLTLSQRKRSNATRTNRTSSQVLFHHDPPAHHIKPSPEPPPPLTKAGHTREPATNIHELREARKEREKGAAKTSVFRPRLCGTVHHGSLSRGRTVTRTAQSRSTPPIRPSLAVYLSVRLVDGQRIKGIHVQPVQSIDPLQDNYL